MLQRLAHPGTADKGAAGTGGGDGVWVRHAVHLTHAPRGLTARSLSLAAWAFWTSGPGQAVCGCFAGFLVHCLASISL